MQTSVYECYLHHIKTECTTGGLGKPLVYLSRKIKDVKEEENWICALWPDLSPVTAQYFLHLSRKYFLCIGKHSPCSENRVGNNTAVLLWMQQQRDSLKKSLGGLVLDTGFLCSCLHKPLTSFPILVCHNYVMRKEQNWHPAHNIRRFGAPCCCHSNFWRRQFALTLTFLPTSRCFFFYSPDILKAI